MAKEGKKKQQAAIIKPFSHNVNNLQYSLVDYGLDFVCLDVLTKQRIEWLNLSFIMSAKLRRDQHNRIQFITQYYVLVPTERIWDKCSGDKINLTIPFGIVTCKFQFKRSKQCFAVELLQSPVNNHGMKIFKSDTSWNDIQSNLY